MVILSGGGVLAILRRDYPTAAEAGARKPYDNVSVL